MARRFLPTLLGALALVALLGSGAAVSAKPTPVIYFLKDGPSGPSAQGVLDPYDPALRNVPNGTQPHSRLVLAGQEMVVPVRFASPDGHTHPDRLGGPVLVGLWLGESTTLHGNLTVTLYEILPGAPAGPLPAVPPAPAPRALASASFALDADLNNTPSPTQFIPPVPPDPAADPQATATGVVFYEAAQLAPLLLKPPVLLFLGNVDLAFNATSQVAIGFRLDPGSSPGPLPVAAFAQVNYDYVLGPSFVYVPWYAPDPPKPAATATSAPPTSATSATGTGSQADATGSATTSDDGKGAPGPGLPLLAAALLAVAAILARRRLA